MSINIEGFIAVAIFVAAHILGSVWWASHVNTLLSIVLKNQTDYISDIKVMRETFVTKERLALAEHEHTVLWKSIEEIKSRCCKNHENRNEL